MHSEGVLDLKHVEMRPIFGGRKVVSRACGTNGQYWSNGAIGSKCLYLFCARAYILVGVKSGESANKWYICKLFYHWIGRFGQK